MKQLKQPRCISFRIIEPERGLPSTEWRTAQKQRLPNRGSSSSSPDLSSPISASSSEDESQPRLAAEELCDLKGIDPEIQKYQLPPHISLKVRREQWLHYYDITRRVPIDDYAQLISDEMKKQHDIPCSFTSRGKTAIKPGNKKICASFRGYCGSSRSHQEEPNLCKATFKCHVRNFSGADQDVIIDIAIGGEFHLYQRKTTARQCRGEMPFKKTRNPNSAQISHLPIFKPTRFVISTPEFANEEHSSLQENQE